MTNSDVLYQTMKTKLLKIIKKNYTNLPVWVKKQLFYEDMYEVYSRAVWESLVVGSDHILLERSRAAFPLLHDSVDICDINESNDDLLIKIPKIILKNKNIFLRGFENEHPTTFFSPGAGL